jgi:hypothetical protein
VAVLHGAARNEKALHAEPRLTRTAFTTDLPVAIATVAAAAMAAPLYWAVHYNLTDDAYITLAYAKTLAFHGTWGMVPHHSANAATSPLNVLMIALGTVVIRRPLLALGFVFVCSFTLVGWSIARVARALDIPIIVSPFAVALLLLNPIFLSATGLESAPYIALLATLLACAVERRPIAFGVVAGLGLLTRLDMVLFIIPLMLWTPDLRRKPVRPIGVAICVSLPWFVLRWFLAGSAIPDTFVIKTLQKAFGDVSFGNGPWRFISGAGDVARWSFAPILFGGIATTIFFLLAVTMGGRVERLMPVAALAIGGVAYYAAYTALRVPAYHWYYNPVTGVGTIVLVLFAGAAARGIARISAVRQWRVGWATLLVFALPALMLFREARVEQKHGIPWRHTPVFFGNWAEPEYYRIAGRALRHDVGTDTVASPPEIGTLAFYCECSIINEFSDTRFATPFIRERIAEAGPLLRFLLNANYENLDTHAAEPHIDDVLLYIPGFAPPAPFVWNTWSQAKGPGHLALVPAF